MSWILPRYVCSSVATWSVYILVSRLPFGPSWRSSRLSRLSRREGMQQRQRAHRGLVRMRDLGLHWIGLGDDFYSTALCTSDTLPRRKIQPLRCYDVAGRFTA